MERIIYKEIECIRGYHTQEYRSTCLDRPLPCKRTDAWLGHAYYFWTEIEFAKYWGIDGKMATGAYDVYAAIIEFTKVLNTVFDEKGYNFFVSKVAMAIEHFKALDVNKLDLQKINRYLVDEVWSKVGIIGILFEDVPYNPKNKPDRIYSEIPPLHYIKRIQLAVFDLKIIHNFELLLEEQTN